MKEDGVESQNPFQVNLNAVSAAAADSLSPPSACLSVGLIKHHILRMEVSSVVPHVLSGRDDDVSVMSVLCI